MNNLDLLYCVRLKIRGFYRAPPQVEAAGEQLVEEEVEELVGGKPEGDPLNPLEARNSSNSTRDRSRSMRRTASGRGQSRASTSREVGRLQPRDGDRVNLGTQLEAEHTVIPRDDPVGTLVERSKSRNMPVAAHKNKLGG